MRAMFVALTLIIGATGCGKGERPFRMVQFCLASPQDIKTVKNALRGAASANKLSFYDRSKETEAEMASIAEGRTNMPVAYPTVNVGTFGPDAMGFSAGNVPEAPSQIVVAFSESDDTTAARALSDAVVHALSKHWHIHEVPTVEASGASPMKDCD